MADGSNCSIFVLTHLTHPAAERHSGGRKRFALKHLRHSPSSRGPHKKSFRSNTQPQLAPWLPTPDSRPLNPEP